MLPGVILSLMGCSVKWAQPDDLVGLDEDIQRFIKIPSLVPLAIVLAEP